MFSNRMSQTMRAVGLAIPLVVSVTAPAMGATASAESPSIDVAQDDGVTVTVTDGTTDTVVANASVNETTAPFGLQVAASVSGSSETEGPRGPAIPEWVTANDPGNETGPPDHAGNESESNGGANSAGEANAR